MRSPMSDTERIPLRRGGRSMDYLRLREVVRHLLPAAEAVNEGVMSNGLAYKRDALRYRIAETRAMLERLDEDNPAGGDRS